MTDRDLVNKKLAQVETYVAELRLANHLDDLLGFVTAVRAMMGGPDRIE